MTPEEIRMCKKNRSVWVDNVGIARRVEKGSCLWPRGTQWALPSYFPTRTAAQAAIEDRERKRLSRIEGCRKSMEPITPEQAKDLRMGDEFFYLQAGGGSPRYSVTQDKLDKKPDITTWNCFVNGRAYWTREAAEAALAKQKAVASRETPSGETQPDLKLTDETQDKEPVKYAERKDGEAIKDGDDVTWASYCVPLSCECEPTRSVEHAWNAANSWIGRISGEMLSDECTTRARYITPEWKAWKDRQDAKQKPAEPVKPTTVKEWLETIPIPAIREAALRQHDLGFRVYYIPSDLSGAIGAAFLWRKSIEGNDFWDSCYEAASGRRPWPYPTKAKQEADGWTQEEIDKAAVSNKSLLAESIKRDITLSQMTMEEAKAFGIKELGKQISKPHGGFSNGGYPDADSKGSILSEAEKLVHGDRRRDYGTPDENFGRIARRWTAILGHPVTTTQVVECMIALKFARQEEKPKRDNWVDIAGYAQCGSELTTNNKQ